MLKLVPVVLQTPKGFL